MIGEKPYLYPAGYYRGMVVWVVDGNWIRTNKDIEFTDWGQHYDKRYVPKGQIWIDYGADQAEVAFFSANAWKEYHLMANGMSYARAEEIGDETERALRQSDRVAGSIKLGFLQTVGPVAVWLVNGRAVRNEFDVDYTEGGHDRKYAWIPKDEIWLDNTVQELERPFVFLHELFERNKMGEGWKYAKAHRAASAIELACRRGRADVEVELRKEMEKASEIAGQEVTVWKAPYVSGDKPYGDYSVEEAADLLGLRTSELLKELADHGFARVGEYHAEFKL